MKLLSMCMVFEGEKSIDMGSYYDNDGERVLVTSSPLAERYGYLVDCPIYIRKEATK